MLIRYVMAPTDKLRRVIDLSGWLAAGETISSIETSASPELTVTAVAPLAPANTAFQFFFQITEPAAGTYKIMFETATTDGQIRTDEVQVIARVNGFLNGLFVGV